MSWAFAVWLWKTAQTQRHALANGLVDELFCTVAPKMVGGSALRTLVEGPALPLDRLARLELVSLYHHENELFCRYRIIR